MMIMTITVGAGVDDDYAAAHHATDPA